MPMKNLFVYLEKLTCEHQMFYSWVLHGVRAAMLVFFTMELQIVSFIVDTNMAAKPFVIWWSENQQFHAGEPTLE